MKQIGGQALVDGIVMVGKKCTAIVRRKSSGRISVETTNKCISKYEGFFDKIFVLRGIAYFLRVIRDGILNLELYYGEEKNYSGKVFSKFLKKLGMVSIGILFLFFVFLLLPEYIVSVVAINNIQLVSLAKFSMRVLIMILYLFVISKNKNLSPLLRYHCAEHKTISCYELGNKLTVDNVRDTSKFHRKCGSVFITYMLIWYFVLQLVIPRYSLLINLLIEVLIFPVVIGLSNEIIEYIGRSNSMFSSLLFGVSKVFQEFTTKEPDDNEIEVATVALKTCEGIRTKNTIKELFLMGRSILREASIDSYALDSRLILEYCMGVTPSQVFTSEMEVPNEDEEKYLEFINQRKRGKPIAYMIGKKEFCGHDFVVKDGVLIPRPDTEILVEKVLEILKNKKEYMSICDLCSGSGAIGISIQKNNELVNCTYVDNYDIPLKVIEENVYMHDLKSRSYITKSNLLEFFIENDLELDGIVSNPPYIKSGDIKSLMKDVRDYEPIEALDGGEDGLDYYKKICKQAKSVLVENGFIAFEIPHDKAIDIMNIMASNRFVNIDIHKDINGRDRVIVGYYRSKK